MKVFHGRNATFSTSAVVKDGKVYLFYRAQDAMGTSRIGLAISEDGLHFKKHTEPVFYPDRDTMYVYEWNYRKREMSSPLEDCKSCYFDGVEDPRIIEDENGTIANKFSLNQNYPNPFNPSTKIRFALPKSGNVTLKVFDISGQVVATLVNGNLQAGEFEYTLDGSNLSSGIYFYRIKSGEFTQTNKMILLK